MLKTIELSNILIFGRNKGKVPVSERNIGKVLVSRKNKSDSEVVRFDISGTDSKQPHY